MVFPLVPLFPPSAVKTLFRPLIRRLSPLPNRIRALLFLCNLDVDLVACSACFPRILLFAKKGKFFFFLAKGSFCSPQLMAVFYSIRGVFSFLLSLSHFSLNRYPRLFFRLLTDFFFFSSSVKQTAILADGGDFASHRHARSRVIETFS